MGIEVVPVKGFAVDILRVSYFEHLCGTWSIAVSRIWIFRFEPGIDR
jgi:hypothetical protein